ncbi:MAG: primosomal protein N' [Clostridia bacterium]|nr:primosomal protein N' [Clostridia bacterium]
MVLPLIVKVAVEQTEFHYDKPYGYIWPDRLGEPVRGLRVLVPFGGGNRKRQAVVMEVCNDSDFEKLKPVYERLDETPLYTEELLDLALWMKERFFCTVFDALRAMIPPGLYMKIKPSYQMTASFLSIDLTPEEQQLVDVVKQFPDGADLDAVQKLLGKDLATETALNALVKKGVLVRAEEANQKSGVVTVKMARSLYSPDELDELPEAEKLTAKQRKVLAVLQECGSAAVKELCLYASVTNIVVQNLCKKGFIEIFDREVLRSPTAGMEETIYQPPVLNEEQQQAFDTLHSKMQSGEPVAALLYGVTGSGKTQVYMQLIDAALSENKQALVLVPEISLTPQSVRLFVARFGKRVAVLHSGLSVGERMDEWRRIRSGAADVVVGTRSAVFAPLDRLGLLVIDEEQEHTYKSESAPRFHARDVAKFRCARHGALLLLASATPSMETYHLALDGTYTLCKLTSRFGKARLPEVTTVDMRTDVGDSLMFSHTLRQAMEDCFEEGKQAILLLNRRGYNTFLSCHSCGSVLMCPSCSISLTYHIASEQLVCHYCGYSTAPPRACPTCDAKKIRYAGMGTQKAERELRELFPNRRILRMDADTTVSRYAYEEKFQAFAAGEYDVMIGTQMVAKGLDFPKVGLVGVLSADQALYNDDFRAYETTFSLLTQVIGRAGRRDDIPSRAIVQTFTPENPVISLAAAQDFDGFYQMEIAARKMMHYPPYSSLYQFGFVGREEAEVRQTAHAFLAALREKVSGTGIPVIALDVAPAMVARISGKYRYKLLIKTRNTRAMRELIAKLLGEFGRNSQYKNVTVFADIDPAVMM